MNLFSKIVYGWLLLPISLLAMQSAEPDQNKVNQLWNAINNGNIEQASHVINSVSDRSALVNSYHGGIALLRQAATNGNVAMVKLLLYNGAEVDPADSYDMTPLMFAALNGHKDVVALLIQRGADVNARDGSGQSVLNWVSFGGGTTQAQKDEITKMLQDAGAH